MVDLGHAHGIEWETPQSQAMVALPELIAWRRSIFNQIISGK
jgi:hypothetical protein